MLQKALYQRAISQRFKETYLIYEWQLTYKVNSSPYASVCVIIKREQVASLGLDERITLRLTWKTMRHKLSWKFTWLSTHAWLKSQ